MSNKDSSINSDDFSIPERPDGPDGPRHPRRRTAAVPVEQVQISGVSLIRRVFFSDADDEAE